MVPKSVRADALLGPGRQLDQHLLEPEVAVDGHDELVHPNTLIRQLLFGAKNVCIVLVEAAHAHQPMQCTRRLVAVHHAELGDAVGQLAVGAQPVLEDLDVARAVHRLDGKLALVFGDGGEHVFPVPFPVS